jgi:sugar lactone lactonase YvrE
MISIASFEAIMNSVSSRVCWNALSWFNFNQSGPCQKHTWLTVWCAAMVVAMSGGWSPSLAQTKAATTTTLAVTSGSAAVTQVASGSVVTLTANVRAGTTAVTPGQVNFCDASAKSCTDIHLLGTVQLTGAGTATMKFRPGIGKHSYKAVFPGTKKAAGSTSGASALAATGAIPPLTTAATINQTGSWGAYALSATVTETGNTAPPTGTVSFLDTNHGNAVLGRGTLGSATRGVGWTNVSTSAPSIAGVSYAVADLNRDGIPDLFVKDYFGTYDVLLGKGDGTFTVAGTPFGPYSETGTFIVGDFNNDGIPDVAAIDGSYYAPSNTITIFLGNGDGTFIAAGSSLAIGYNPTAITAADMNGDGNADLIVVQEASSTSLAGQVVIFFGNGDGTFTQASSTTSLASVANSILPTDLNDDGNVDLVLGGVGSSGIAILLGKGDGTFTSAANVPQAGEATPVIADVNNDGFPDLVFGAPGTYDLTVFLGNGDGSFTEAPSSPNANLKTGNLAIGDFNQDGIPDIVYSVPNTTSAGILFGNGDGTFVQTPATLSYDYDFSGDLVVADFNGDGWPDVLTQDGNSRTVIDSLTQPTETATASAVVSIAVAGQHLADASYPGDSHYTSSTSGTIALWGAPSATTTALKVTSGGASVSSVSPGTVVTLTATVATGASPVTAGQVNFCDASATSCTDIHLLGTTALNSAGTAALKFVPGAGAHSYKAEFIENGFGLTSPSAASALTVGPAKSIIYADATTISASGFAGNYTLNATVTGFGGSAPPTGSVSFLDTSFGNATLATATLGSSVAGSGWLISQTPATAAATISEVTGDFNGDGIPDLAVLSVGSVYNASSTVTILSGKGDGTFTAGPTIQVTGAQNYPTMIGADFNGDGKTDLAVLSWNGYSISYVTTLLGKGDGTFGAPQTGTVFNQGMVGGDGVMGSMVAADFNGDGKMDIAVVGDYIAPGGVTIMLGKGDGTFNAAGPNLAPTADFGQIATGDFNGDGIPDIVITKYFEDGSSPVIFLGKGDGTFTSLPTSFTLDYFPTSIAVGDFNGDGVLDLAFSDLNGVEIALGAGDGTFKETAASPISVPSELYSLTVGDFNNDGKVDLAGVNNYNDRIVLLAGAGDGTFTVTATTPAVSQDWLGPFQIVLADFNSDGVPDLAMLTKNATTVSILLTEPTETASASVQNIAPVGVGTHNVEASYAGDSHYPSSVSATTALTAGLVPLVISPAAGTYTTVQTIKLSESIPGATIYYSAWGAVNTTGFVQYTGPIQLTEGGVETIEAYATETGYQQSDLLLATYKMSLPAAPAPAFSVAPGGYQSAQTILISDSVTGATIHYTTNGTLPTANSSQYTGPITVSTSETIVATAIAPGYSMSTPATAQYIIDSSSTPLIYTVAGNGTPGWSGDGGPATLAELGSPGQTALDSAGNLYIADTYNQVIRKVASGTKAITTVAGNGTPGYSGDHGAATSAQLSFPSSVTVDSKGNLYIADYNNSVIRKVSASSGVITTIAGNGTSGYSGDNGAATSAELSYPTSLAIDGAGNLLIADTYNDKIRKVAVGTGVITTIAGTGQFGNTGDNGPATSADLESPEGIAVDGSGNFYFSCVYAQVVRKVTAATGVITTVAGTGSTYYQGGYSGDGGPATRATLNYPSSVAVDNSGNLYIADTNNSAIRKVTGSTGIITTAAGNGSVCNPLSGDGGPAASAGLCYPNGVTVGSAGDVYISDSSSFRIREVTVGAAPTKKTATPTFSIATGTYATPQTVTITDATPGALVYVSFGSTAPSTISPGYNGPINVTGTETINAIAVAPGYLASAAASATYTITMPPSATISTVAGNGVYGSSGASAQGTSASIGYPSSVATDKAGNLYFTDLGNNMVWKVSASSGDISAFAGNGTVGYGGNGGPATAAQLDQPLGIAVDGSGNVFIADSNNDVVRVSASTGVISTMAGVYNQPGFNSTALGDGGPATAAYLYSPGGLALDSSGNLYIADTYHDEVRKVSATTGIISTVAGGAGSQNSGSIGDGGPAIGAQLSYPGQLAIDSVGNLYICDIYNGRVRKVTAASGIITTVAGNGLRYGISGDGGPATSAPLSPQGVAVNAAGDLYISNGRAAVRKVDASTGIITKAAGNGYPGYFGDGGSATIAEVYDPQGLALDSSGNLYLADQANFRIRKVTFLSPVATPAFSLAGGTYVGSRTVTITDTTAGAAIYYTTSGTTPTTSSTKYTAPITVSATETIEAIAVASGYANSPVATATYTIMKVAATPTFSPAAGTYTSTQSVTISDTTVEAAIYYTTNGTPPTTSSTKYTGAISVSSTETLEAIAVGTGYSASAVSSATYTINRPTATPSFSPAGGTYTSIQNVTINDATAGATIYYTTDGSTPSSSSTVYSGPISVSATKTIKAIATASGYSSGAVGSAAYTINLPFAAAPSFSPAAGTYTSAQTVIINDNTKGATIYYTTNGVTPTSSSTKYTAPITVSATETIETIAVASGYTNSPVATATYTIMKVTATPTFSPTAGTYTSAQSVTIADTTAGATIYYTTNGASPTTASTKYTGPIKVSATETLEAIAVATGYSQSAVAAGAYTLATTPTVTTRAATSQSTSGATLNGTVTANNATTQYWFAWGTSKTSLISNTTKNGPLTGTTSSAVAATLTGLKTKTTYYFQAVASNAVGTTSGAVLSFTTN